MVFTDAEVTVLLYRVRQAVMIGAAARAAKNMGIERLRLIEPPPHFRRSAVALARNSVDVLEQTDCFIDLVSASEDQDILYGVSCRRVPDDVKTISPAETVSECNVKQTGQHVGIVFCESPQGLLPDDKSLIHAWISIPRPSDAVPLNIAQAVLIVSYELFLSRLETPLVEQPARASEAFLQRFFTVFSELLTHVGYLTPNDPEQRMQVVHTLFNRANLTPREVGVWLGVCRDLRMYLKPEPKQQYRLDE